MGIKVRNPVAVRTGLWIKANRKRLGWSQTKLGLKMRTRPHVTSISDWERGENVPSGHHLGELARVFDELPPTEDEEDPDVALELGQILARNLVDTIEKDGRPGVRRLRGLVQRRVER